MSTDTVRFGLVGAGSISQHHLNAIKNIPGATAVAICDVEDRARQRAQEYDIPETYTDYRDMLQKAPIDAVIVAVPNFLHHEVSLAALKAGKHVLCEKPMAISTQYAEQMVQAARQNNKLLSIGFVCRYAKSSELTRSMVAAGDLGKVYYAKAVKTRRKGIPGWGSWFTQKKVAGGGSVFDIGVHALDLTWYVMGCPQPISVSGFTQAAFGPQKKGLGEWGTPNFNSSFDVEDMGIGFIRFANGAVINLETSWALHTDDEDYINIMGDKAGVKLAPLGKDLRIYSEVDGDLVNSTRVTDAGTMDSIFLGQMRNFVSAITEGTPLRAPAEHGLVVTRMLEAIYASAKSGREVRLD